MADFSLKYIEHWNGFLNGRSPVMVENESMCQLSSCFQDAPKESDMAPGSKMGGSRYSLRHQISQKLYLGHFLVVHKIYEIYHSFLLKRARLVIFFFPSMISKSGQNFARPSVGYCMD